jgi:type IV secretion system protein VirB4
MGKTVLVTHLLAQCERYDPPPQVAFFDQYRGADIGIRALGGAYHVLQDGIPTGCNPLKALSPDNPRDMAFLRFLARGMIGGEIDPENQRSIGLSLQMVMELPPEGRSWGEVRAFLGYERGGIGERLDIWCEGNEYGWALDCQEDRMAFDHRLTGYDTTQILTNEVTLGPIQAYLAYRTEAIIDGRRAIVVIDEFHHWLENAFWAKRAASLARTIRRRNGVLIMLTQHPADLAKCPFGHTIMQQTPQQFFAPDRRAKPEEYVGGAQINEPMFDMIKRRMQVGQGQFLRVVDGEAMVIQPPLGGLDAHMAVLSSRDEAVKLAATIRAEHGDQWLGQFMQRHAEAAP